MHFFLVSALLLPTPLPPLLPSLSLHGHVLSVLPLVHASFCYWPALGSFRCPGALLSGRYHWGVHSPLRRRTVKTLAAPSLLQGAGEVRQYCSHYLWLGLPHRLRLSLCVSLDFAVEMESVLLCCPPPVDELSCINQAHHKTQLVQTD